MWRYFARLLRRAEDRSTINSGSAYIDFIARRDDPAASEGSVGYIGCTVSKHRRATQLNCDGRNSATSVVG